MIFGIDVDYPYQQGIDWATLKKIGVQFAMIKSTEGIGWVNPDYALSLAGARANGLGVGHYHFARPDQNANPVDDVSYCLAKLDLQPGEPVALDLEVGSGALQAWATVWLQTFEHARGFKPLLYTSRGFAFEHSLNNNTDLNKYGLWLASYETTLPDPIPVWDFWAMWQFNDRATVPGVPSPVDVDLFNGTLDQFRAYGRAA